MSTPRLPASPWEVSKHATPDHSPQFGIYASDDEPQPFDFIIVRGSEETARAVATLPDALRTLNTFRVWLDCPSLDKKTLKEMYDRAETVLREAGYTF